LQYLSKIFICKDKPQFTANFQKTANGKKRRQ